jgi:hypothetical protein
MRPYAGTRPYAGCARRGLESRRRQPSRSHAKAICKHIGTVIPLTRWTVRRSRSLVARAVKKRPQLLREGESAMPLTPSKEAPALRLIDIVFTMLDHGRHVTCRITLGALDVLQPSREVHPLDRFAQVAPTIWSIASAKYDQHDLLVICKDDIEYAHQTTPSPSGIDRTNNKEGKEAAISIRRREFSSTRF